MPIIEPEHTEFLHLTVPARLGCLHWLREHVRRCVAGLPISPERQAEIILAVDEAATNAIEHAYQPGQPGEFELTLWCERDALCIQIVDHGTWREPSVTTGSVGPGLGITLMQRLVDGVVIHHGPAGTNVLLRPAIGDPDADQNDAARQPRPPRHARPEP